MNIDLNFISTAGKSQIEIVEEATGNKIIINDPTFENITGEAIMNEAAAIFKDLFFAQRSVNRIMIFNKSARAGSIQQFFAFRLEEV